MNVLLIGDSTIHKKMAKLISHWRENSGDGSRTSFAQRDQDIDYLNIEVCLLKSTEDATILIKELIDSLGIIVLGPGVTPQKSTEFFSHVRGYGLTTPPVFIWTSSLSHEEVCNLNFYATNLFNKYLPLDSVNLEGLLIDALNSTIEELKRENLIKYSKISIERLLEHNYINCDVYLQLSSIKLIKLINKNELFSREIIEKYLKKGVKHLYVKSEDYMTFTEFVYKTLKSKFSILTDDLSGQLNLSVEGTQIIQEMLATLKVDATTMKILNEVTIASINILKSKNQLRTIMAQLADRSGYLYVHSVLTSYISGLIALKMHWSSTVTLQKLALASILHDVGLEDDALARISNLHGIDYKTITWSEVEKIKKHPQTAVQLLNRLDDLPPDISTIVLTHHERPDGCGFPRGLTSNGITQIDCLFIIAEDFVNQTYGKSIEQEMLRALTSGLPQKYAVGNYRKSLEGLLKVLEEALK